MRRSVVIGVRLLAYVAFGGLVTVGLAWMLAWNCGAVPEMALRGAAAPRWAARDLGEHEFLWMEVHRGGGVTVVVCNGSHNATGTAGFRRVGRVACGWPLRAMQVRWRQDWRHFLVGRPRFEREVGGMGRLGDHPDEPVWLGLLPEEMPSAPLPAQPAPPGFVPASWPSWVPRVIPTRPVWMGLALDTVFFGGGLWLVVSGPRVVRRRVRRRRGRCLRCGYDLSGVPTGFCPECGPAREEFGARGEANPSPAPRPESAGDG